MNKKLLSTLIGLFIGLNVTFNAKADVRISNKSKYTAFVFITHLKKPRRVVVEVPIIKDEQLDPKDLSSHGKKRFSYLMKGAKDIAWYEVHENGKIRYFQGPRTKTSALVSHFTILNNGKFKFKGKTKQAKEISWETMSKIIKTLR